MSDDPKCANEPALILAGMISTSAPFAHLHPCAAVPIAAQIVDAIREGKVPGLFHHPSRDLMQALTDVDTLRAQLDAATKRAQKYCLDLGAMQTERDEARAKLAETEAMLGKARDGIAGRDTVILTLEAQRDEAVELLRILYEDADVYEQAADDTTRGWCSEMNQYLRGYIGIMATISREERAKVVALLARVGGGNATKEAKP